MFELQAVCLRQTIYIRISAVTARRSQAASPSPQFSLMHPLSRVLSTSIACLGFLLASCVCAQDPIAKLQADAVASNQSDWGHWGPDATKYSSWTTHSNRLVPVYTFGLNLKSVSGENSVYRSVEKLEKVYGFLPTHTVNPEAEYFDQTDIYHLQREAIAAGKKRIILFVFDGMDWQTTRAAAIAKSGAVQYDSGHGQGLAFQDYRGAENDFGFMVTSPHNNGTNINVDDQKVTNPGGKTPGGYDASRAGTTPWASFPDAAYPISENADDSTHVRHAYTDSSSSAASMTCGVKTYNNGVNVDFSGREVLPIARALQDDGFAIGVVTSVPISHATPAAAYANNVHRDDYQDLTRDLLGRPSIFHPGGLPGVDVLIGAGWGESKDKDGAQGKNFVAGNRYLADDDRAAIDQSHGGNYVIAERTQGKLGIDVLDTAVKQAIAGRHRLFGYFGVAGGHLPFRTADGAYNPVASAGNNASAEAETYSIPDVTENVNLGQMAMAAVEVLDAKSDRWWLMIEAGDVDWANHSNNIDNSIGAVLSGEDAFEKLTTWIEANGGWNDTCLILTADHGHYLVLDKPEALATRAE
jgi:alkaline phosphatase